MGKVLFFLVRAHPTRECVLLRHKLHAESLLSTLYSRVRLAVALSLLMFSDAVLRSDSINTVSPSLRITFLIMY